MQRTAKYIGSTIRAFRNSQNVSREGLAERAGLHPNYLGAVERGEMNPGIENVQKIAKALRIPLYKLFIEPGGKADPLFDELLAIAGAADEETLALMIGLLRTVKEWQSGRKLLHQS
jgi:transcriptional regulator with XRE-family HTH domain